MLNYYKKGDNFDFSKDLFPKLLKDSVPMYGYITEDYWNDIGDLRIYKEVNYDILAGRVRTDVKYKQLGKGIWVGEGCEISDSCNLTAPVLIGDNCRIKDRTIIEASILGDDVEIEESNLHKEEYYLENSRIGKNVSAGGSNMQQCGCQKRGTYF